MRKPPVLLILAGFVLVALTAPLASAEEGDDWPMYRHDLAHTGYTTSEVPRAPNLLWEFDGGGVANSPAVVDGRVYFGSWNNKFYALDTENGEMIWKIETIKDIHTSSPVVVDNVVYFGTGGYNPNLGELYAVNSVTGEIIWVENFDKSINSSLAIANGKVFFGSEYDNIYAVDAETANVIWTRNIGRVYTASPTVVDNTVYIGSWDGNLYALDAEDGSIKWSYQTGGAIDSTPAVVDGVLYIGSGRVPGEIWAIHALDALSGRLIWRRQLDYPVRSSPAVAGGKLFVGAGSEAFQGGENGMIYALSIENGAILWSYPSYGDYIGNSAPALAGDFVITTASGELVVLFAENGKVFWKRGGIGVPVQPVVADGRIYTGTVSSSGEPMGFYCFGTPLPTIDAPADNQRVSGTVRLEGTALGDSVQAVELNWGDGWVEATSLKLELEYTYDYSVPGDDTKRYVNRWSYDWDSRSVPNGTHEIRVRILYTNGAHSDETTITLHVENPPLTELELAAIVAGAIVVIFAVVLWLRRH